MVSLPQPMVSLAIFSFFVCFGTTGSRGAKLEMLISRNEHHSIQMVLGQNENPPKKGTLEVDGSIFSIN